MQAFVDVAAVHIHIKIGNGEQVAADQVGCLVRQGAQGRAGEDPVQVFAVFRDDEFPPGPEALDVNRVQNDQAAADVFRLYVAPQLNGCGDARADVALCAA